MLSISSVEVASCSSIFDYFSVCVSAKENDGGVHAAMQSLVRYLLEKKYSHKMQKTGKSSGKKVFMSSSDAEKYAKTLGSAEDHTFVKLEHTNLKEVIKYSILTYAIINPQIRGCLNPPLIVAYTQE